MKIKIKILKSAKKRFKLTKFKLIKHKSSNTRHLLTKKSNNRKRKLRKISIISNKNSNRIYKLISFK